MMVKNDVLLLLLFSFWVLFSSDENKQLCSHISKAIRTSFGKHNFIITKAVTFDSNTILTDNVIKTYLHILKKNSRGKDLCVCVCGGYIINCQNIYFTVSYFWRSVKSVELIPTNGRVFCLQAAYCLHCVVK